MAIESKARKRNLRIPLALLLAAFYFLLASADALAQMSNTNSLLSRLSSRISRSLKVSFTYGPKLPKQGQSVQFIDSSSGSPTSWIWDFGDGTISTERNPSHIYSSSGFWKVTLTIANGTTSKKAPRTLTVMPSAAEATFVFSPATPGPGETVQFADTTSGSPTSWQWNFGDGGTSSAKNPSRAFAKSGAYTVTLVARDSSGSKQGSKTITVATMSVLAASFTYTPPLPTIAQAVQFTDTSTGTPTSWLWNFGDGETSTSQNPSHTYSTAGSKTVTLIATNSTGSNTSTRTITVGTALTASFSYSPTSPTTGQSVQFTDTSAGSPTSWQWNFGDGTTSTSQNPSHTYATAGSKTATLTVSNTSRSNSTSRSFSVLTALSASFTSSPASPAVGQSIQFTDNSTGTPSIWQWNFGDGATSVAQNPTHSFASAGSYTVTLTIMNTSSSNTTSRAVVVGTSLTASFTYSPSSPTTGQTVQFTDTSTGTPTSWSWNFGDGMTSTLRNPSHAYTTAGSKIVALTVTNGTGSNVATRTVTVGAALTASFSYSPTSPTAGQSVQFTDTSTGSPTSWLWNFGDGTTSTLRNPNHAYLTSGSYAVRLTAATSSNSHTTSMLITVTPASMLSASFSFSPSMPAPDQAVTFRDTSTGTPISWQWNFGDGGTSTIQNPSHSFSTDGSYTVILIAGNVSGSDTVSRTVTVATSSDIVLADRLYDWGAYCGIPGGIPVRTTIYATLQPGATAAQINAAIAACPSGQVVYLSAGTYNLGSGRITFGATESGVTLRGAGPGRTIITGTATNLINNAYREFVLSGGIALAEGGGYTKGSTAITLASAPTTYFAAGNLIVIGEDSSPNKFATGIGTYARDGSTAAPYNLGATEAQRCFRYLVRIERVVGNTLYLAAPLPLDFTYSLNPKAYSLNGLGVTSLCGVEDLTLYNCTDPVRYYVTDRCWVKSVEFDSCPGGDIGALQLNTSFQFEMRRCFIHDTPGYPNQTDGIAVGVNFCVSNGLFIDNIAYRTSAMFEINGATTNAFLYNYAWDLARAANQMACGFYMFYYHGSQGMMNLVEGNIGEKYCEDGYHGSGSHSVVFRNQFHGLHPAYTQQRKIVNLPRGSYYYTVVGNILGDSSYNPAEYEATRDLVNGAIYVLGFPNTGNFSLTPAMAWSTHPNVYPDTAVASTLIRHGNYDYYHKDVVWDSGIASRTIPDSLFYSSKPGFFGSLQWPAIGPDVSGLVSSIPAKARWNAYLVSGRLDDLFRDF